MKEEILKDIEEVYFKLKDIPTLREYLKLGKFSKRQIYNYFKSWNDAVTEAIFNKVYVEDEKLEKASLEEFFDYCETGKKLYKKLENVKYEANIKINSDKPVVAVMAACFHIGSRFTNYKELKEALNLILETPNVYIGVCGDIIDNFIHTFPNKDAINSQILPPDIQAALLKKLIEAYESKNKLLFKVLGNHERFIEKLVGNKLWDLIIGEGSPYLPFGGLVNIQINDVSYRFFVKHKARFASSLNPFHQPLKLYKELFLDADIIVISDQHKPAIATTYFSGKQIGFVRTGTFKIGDPYSLEFEYMNYDNSKGKVEIPSIVLYNDIKKFVLFPTLEDALRYVNADSK